MFDEYHAPTSPIVNNRPDVFIADIESLYPNHSSLKILPENGKVKTTKLQRIDNGSAPKKIKSRMKNKTSTDQIQ